MMPVTNQGKTSLHMGRVSQIDPHNGRAKVTIEELDEIETWWLQCLTPFGTSNEFFVMPNVGDNVAVLLDDEGSRGVILGAYYSPSNTPTLSAINQLAIIIAQTIMRGDIDITGNVTITGDVNITGMSILTGPTDMNGTVSVQGIHTVNGNESLVTGMIDSGGDSHLISGQ